MTATSPSSPPQEVTGFGHPNRGGVEGAKHGVGLPPGAIPPPDGPPTPPGQPSGGAQRSGGGGGSGKDVAPAGTIRVPTLTQAILRAWGLDDPRVLPLLWAENDRSRTQREHTVERRARRAGWPSFRDNSPHGREAATRAANRLEGDMFVWNNRAQHDLFTAPRTRTTYRRATRGTDEDTGALEAVLTIYDE